ncbi:MAG TPA: hypothetical protein VIL36_13155 [Acidimicrobiales bacterium]
MNRRIWTGVVAGVLAAVVLLTVGIGAYQAGQDDRVITRVTETTPADVVRVVDSGRHWGPGLGFFLIPLLVILLIVLLVRGRHHRWHGGYGGPGWYGPGWHRGPRGPYACGPHGGPAVEEGRWEWVPVRRDPSGAGDPREPGGLDDPADPTDPADPADPAGAVTTPMAPTDPAEPPSPRP